MLNADHPALSVCGYVARSRMTVELLEHVESLLAFPGVRDEPFAVISVLYARQLAVRRAEVFEDPRAHTAHVGQLSQSSELVLVDFLLVLLRPSVTGAAMHPELRVAAKFADDDRLVVGHGPGCDVQVRRRAVIPAEVFVYAEHIEIGGQRTL